jgi:CheY-like chemotaxis protein
VPELVLADVAMPELDGTETARLIRRRHPNVVVVLLSAFSRASVTDRDLRVVDKRDLSPGWLADYWRRHGPRR